MKLIAVVVVLSVLSCLDARAVHEKSITKTVRCGLGEHAFSLCRITSLIVRPVVRLVLNPLRIISGILRILGDAINDFIDSFSFEEVGKAALATVTVPVSLVIYLPYMIRTEIEHDEPHDFMRRLVRFWHDEGLDEVLDDLINNPWKVLGEILRIVLFISFIPITVIEGILVAMSESGFPDYFIHKVMLPLKFVEKVFKFIDHASSRSCTDILPQSSCQKFYHAYRHIVIDPVIGFVKDLSKLVKRMHVVEIIEEARKVSLLILKPFTVSQLQKYCEILLSEKHCAKIFFPIKKMADFSEEEVAKAVYLVYYVLRWIIKHFLLLG